MHKSEDEGHESDSAVSTTSSSGVNTDSAPARAWERFDDDDDARLDLTSPSNRPPIPPPRSAIFGETSNSLNPFESNLDARPQSPFDDSFSSSVAQTLSEKANVEESLAARTLSFTSRDIFKIIEEEEEEEANNNPEKAAIPEPLPEPLIPTSSTAMVTANTVTTQARNPPQVSVARGGVTNQMHVSASAPNLPSYGLQGNYFGGYAMNQQGAFGNNNPFLMMDYRGVPLNNIGMRPSGPRSPKSGRKWPQFQSQGPIVYANDAAIQRRSKGPPPPKPEPYSGKMSAVSRQQQTEQNRNELQALYLSDSGSSAMGGKDDKSSDPMLQRLPSLGSFDPFGDILGDGGMKAYINSESSSVS